MRTGDLLVGVLMHPHRLAEALEPILGELRDEDAPDVPPAFGLRWQEHGDGPLRRLHLLYEANCIVARSRDPDAVVRAFLRNLDTLAALEGDRVLLDAAALRRAGSVVLGPARMRAATPWGARFLPRAGVELLPGPGVVVDLAAGTVVVPSGPHAARWEGGHALPAPPATVEVERLEVAGCVLETSRLTGGDPAAEVRSWATGYTLHGDRRRTGIELATLLRDRAVEAVPGDERAVLPAMAELLPG